MYLFIDTNIFLSFFHLTSDDLEQINKLVTLVERQEIKLFIPNQVIDEFKRNREVKVKDGLKKFEESIPKGLSFPAFYKGYPEYEEISALQKALNEKISQLRAKAYKDIESNSLKADKIIDKLFQISQKIVITDEIYQSAIMRVNIGNPPGKKGSLGDALNWECLLSIVPNDNDLFFISDDSDYHSAINRDLFNNFLIEEWISKKNGSKVRYYSRLTSFFNQHYTGIKLASELEKNILIKQLSESWSFERTHMLISKLSKYPDFSSEQLNDIIQAYITNDQIYRILSDSDVMNFVNKAVSGKEKSVDQEIYKLLLDKYPEPENDSEE